MSGPILLLPGAALGLAGTVWLIWRRVTVGAVVGGVCSLLALLLWAAFNLMWRTRWNIWGHRIAFDEYELMALILGLTALAWVLVAREIYRRRAT
jgi:tellurite resistance protein TehA-like permease